MSTSRRFLRPWKACGSAVLLLAAVGTTGCRSSLRAGLPRDAALELKVDAVQIEDTGGTLGADGMETGGTLADVAGNGDTGSGAIDSGVEPDVGGMETADSPCSLIVAQLASEMPTTGTCTAIVRLDYSTLRIVSHALVCGPHSPPDEATARSTASIDAPVAPAAMGKGRLLSGPSPRDEWVFFQSPTDFGGAAAVSARSGLTVFAGSIVWMGTGAITVPSAWDARELGVGCPGPKGLSVRSFDLSQGEAVTRFEDAAAVVLGTGLPSAFQRWGEVFDVVVLLYPRTLGMFASETAEYIVLINGGAPQGRPLR